MSLTKLRSFWLSMQTNKKPTLKKKAATRRQGWLAKVVTMGDRLTFNWAMREMLYRHLSAQVSNGVAVEVALDAFSARLKRRKKPSSEKLVIDVARRMRDGVSLSVALAKWIPDDEAGMIASGELSGNLPRSLDLVIESKRRIARVQRAYRMSLVRPAIYSVAVYGVLWAIGAFVTPSLMLVLPSSQATGLVVWLYAASAFAGSWLVMIPPLVLLLLATVIARSLPLWLGRQRVAAESIFPYSFYRDMQGYIWLMSFSALLRAGLPDVDILKRQMLNANPWLKERLREIRARMVNGATLPAALLAKGRHGMPAFGFPNPDIVDDIQSMAGFTDFPERISKLATQWADEIEASTLSRAAVFGFAMEMFMYMVMGLLMMAINSMSTQLGSVTGM
ncbi:MAG: type II secretion system F family protein [Ottowia sp.]|nr:type II secretion system F family protein [Ottowia sp.]